MKTQSTKVITWIPKQVNVKDVKPTPNNYKIKTDLGKERLAQSIKSFGLAGTVVVNTDLCLIDGNSRLIDAKEKGEKKIWVSMPNRKLSPAEFKEMSALYDFAKAGEVDVERIKKEQGTHKDFFAKWKLDVPMELLKTLGTNVKGDNVGKAVKPIVEGVKKKDEVLLVQLFFNEAEEKEFRILEEALLEKFKTVNTTETVLKAMRAAAKGK